MAAAHAVFLQPIKAKFRGLFSAMSADGAAEHCDIELIGPPATGLISRRWDFFRFSCIDAEVFMPPPPPPPYRFPAPRWYFILFLAYAA